MFVCLIDFVYLLVCSYVLLVIDWFAKLVLIVVIYCIIVLLYVFICCVTIVCVVVA